MKEVEKHRPASENHRLRIGNSYNDAARMRRNIGGIPRKRERV